MKDFNIRISKRGHTIYLLSTFCFFFIFLIISTILYPEEFTIFTNYVSNLGNSEDNPVGHWFFNSSLMITAVLIIPNFLYIQKIFKKYPGNTTSNRFMHLSIIFCLLGSINLFLVGIITEPLGTIHYVFAGIAMASIFTAADILFFITLVKDKLRKNLLSNKYVIIGFSILYIQLVIFMFGGIIVLAFRDMLYANFGTSVWIARYQFWECMQFISLLSWTVLYPFFLKKADIDLSF